MKEINTNELQKPELPAGQSAAHCSLDFNYVDIVTSGCDGWLNLFFGDTCITLVNDVDMATNIRDVVNKSRK